MTSGCPPLQISATRFTQLIPPENKRMLVSDRVSARTCHHAKNQISPTGEKFKKRAGTLAKEHPGPDVGPERADEFGGPAQLRSRPLRYMIPETMTNCRVVRMGRSASGIGSRRPRCRSHSSI